MTREAAYLGVPAWSLFQNEDGAVDLYLSSLGRRTLIKIGAAFPPLPAPRAGRPLEPLSDRREYIRDQVVELMIERAGLAPAG